MERVGSRTHHLAPAQRCKHTRCSLPSSRASSHVAHQRKLTVKYQLSSSRSTAIQRNHLQVTRAAATAQEQEVGLGEVAEVETLKGVRVSFPEEGNPLVEYLVAWKDGSPDTWEPVRNLADNLLRDYEERWWGCARKANAEVMTEMLAGGGKVLAQTIDDNGRCALHFAAALGSVPCTEMLLKYGADPDVGDKDGFTPLHMAAGYLHTSTVTALLQGGADPEFKDKNGRDVLQLVDSLRAGLPANNPMVLSRRMALEEVARVLTDNLYEDVEPAAILDVRVNEDGSREFLVKFGDGSEDLWLSEKYVSEDVIEDHDGGIEYAQADRLLEMRQRGDERKYLVRWLDGYPDSWEPEENVSPDLVALFEKEQGGESRGGDGAVTTAATQPATG